MNPDLRNRKLWDCDSSLYDSFEVESFARTVDAAIKSRSLSMPRLSDPDPIGAARAPKKQFLKVFGSAQRLIKWVFRVKNSTCRVGNKGAESRSGCGGRVLAAIPEVWENGELPKNEFPVRKSKSVRFPSLQPNRL